MKIFKATNKYRKFDWQNGHSWRRQNQRFWRRLSVLIDTPETLSSNPESLMYKLAEARIISILRPRHSYQLPLDGSQLTLDVVSNFWIQFQVLWAANSRY
jgi:hypothetical protein